KNQSGSGSNTSLAVSLPSAVGSGHAIVVAATTWGGSHPPISSVTDSKNNTYVKAVGVAEGQDNDVSVWYALNVTGGSNFTVTVPTASGAAITLAAHEYAGVASVNALDKTSAQTVTTGSTAASSGSATTTQPNEVIFGAFGYLDYLDTTATAGSGFTMRQQQTSNTNYETLYTEDKLVSTTGSYQTTLTFAQAVKWRAVMVTLSATPVADA